QLLTEKRMNLDAAMRTIESKMTAGKNLDVDVGYAITALNDINQALYFILESEKSSLYQAKKDCKKGKPGTSGKPSSAGKEGKKGAQKPAQKPAGRKKGRTGEPKEGQQGSKPGTSGKPGEKELLKRIEAAKEEIFKSGDRSEKLLENIERLKEEVLFNKEKTEKDLNELEERLWRVEESVFDKKELGESRDSESGNESKSKDGESIDFKVLKSKETDLPLPVLKRL
ncbi:MAG: collagen-like protein, partial [Bacteroidetes bacterium]|nr:collagen-like protein [Bacteroidota bacterium]